MPRLPISIQRLNLAANVLLKVGLLLIFGGLSVGSLFGGATILGITLPVGFATVITSLLLTFAIDRVKCPQCGKPFNRPEYRSWFIRHFAKTQSRRSCAHCGYDGRETAVR